MYLYSICSESLGMCWYPYLFFYFKSKYRIYHSDMDKKEKLTMVTNKVIVGVNELISFIGLPPTLFPDIKHIKTHLHIMQLRNYSLA
jgi:hypothetical protein